MSGERQPTRVLTGLAVSDGIAIGRAVTILNRAIEILRLPLAEEAIGDEVARFRTAVDQTRAAIESTRKRAGLVLGEELEAIFRAHDLLLHDPAFVGRVEKRIAAERVNAEWAVHQTSEELQKRFAAIEDPYLRERAHDLEDVSRQLLRVLSGVGHHDLSEIAGDVILVADDLTPSEAIRYGRGRVVGFAVESGGRTSHTSIIARSLSIPALCGLANATATVATDDPVILDGEMGTLILHPSAELLERYRERRFELAHRTAASAATRDLAAVTRDGVAIELMANVDLPEELGELARYGAHGIGLYRSEFLFMETEPNLPSEEEHFQLYRKLAEGAAPWPAVIRTYDLGGRKLAREMMQIDEENPVLGLRGIRLTLARPQIFRTQLRGILRASAYGEVWMMAPLVSRVEEIRATRALVAELCAELDREGLAHSPDLKIGVMIEVPAAAVFADLLAREADFFALGTNDLVQYSLAVDRNNRHVAELYQPFHPAIVRMIGFTARAAQAAGIPVSLCGEMASDLRAVPLLLALGLRRLSLNPRKIPGVKQVVRDLDLERLEQAVGGWHELGTAEEVERAVAAASDSSRRPDKTAAR